MDGRLRASLFQPCVARPSEARPAGATMAPAASSSRAAPSLPARGPRAPAAPAARGGLAPAPRLPGRRSVAARSALLGAASLQGVFVNSSLAVMAYFVFQELLGDRSPKSGRECPSCQGTGVEACFCTRWSDGDNGCSSCNMTGKMPCRACRGGGTAVPIALEIYMDEEGIVKERRRRSGVDDGWGQGGGY